MVEEVRRLTTEALVKIALRRYSQGCTEMVRGNPELFRAISKRRSNPIFKDADSVQNIGPVRDGKWMKEVKSLWICGW